MRAEETVKLIAEIKQQESIPTAQACRAAGVPYSTHKRWKACMDVGLPPVCEPGPKPTGPLDMERLMADIRALAHGIKRTHGTGALIEDYHDGISRRDIQDLIRQVREEVGEARAENTRHLEWSQPGSVMATDTTEVVVGNEKQYVQTIRDLASRYTLTPHAGHALSDAEVAQMLDTGFTQIGAPLFLKRDNGSNENGPATAAVLAKWWVIPLNSPVAYPQYNGAVERAQDEIQDALAAALIPAPCAPEHAAAHIGRVAHELNHKHRDSLHGQCACQMFHAGRRRVIVTLKQRKEVAEEIKEMAARILAKIEEPTPRQEQKAWRLAVEAWLKDNGYVTEKKRELLPNFFAPTGS